MPGPVEEILEDSVVALADKGMKVLRGEILGPDRFGSSMARRAFLDMGHGVPIPPGCSPNLVVTVNLDGRRRSFTSQALADRAKAFYDTSPVAEEPEQDVPAESSDVVPKGTVDDVLSWVGSDPERAQEALQAELDGKNRSTLVDSLSELVEGLE